ncbi:hypothetical protein Tco_1023010 [Tanacetum coccineum]
MRCRKNDYDNVGTHFEIDVKIEDTVADMKKNIETVQGTDVHPAAQNAYSSGWASTAAAVPKAPQTSTAPAPTPVAAPTTRPATMTLINSGCRKQFGGCSPADS